MKKFTNRPPSGTNYESFIKRLDWIKGKTGITIDPEEKKWGSELKGIIENPIGFVKMPLAIAGPVVVDGTYAKGEFLVPLCTVEATLSMSLNRGAYCTALAGGIRTKHLRQTLSRSPAFYLKDLDQAESFIQWIKGHFREIKAIAESTTRYGKLQAIEPHYVGSNVILDFLYTTGDAAGQNMTTFSTSEACKWIVKQYSQPLDYIIESNFNGDKNVSYRSLFKGRGHSVVAETKFERALIEKLCGKGIVEKVLKAGHISSSASQLSGVLTHNLHTANALSAMYIACGQDAACVVENSMSIFSAERTEEGDLKFYLNMPSITVGTVGGGTKLEDQNKNLQMMGCTGIDSAKKFAEIVAASCLAIEISLALAVTMHEFVQAHQKYSLKVIG